MPNWCSNNLTITASNDEQKELLKQVSSLKPEEGFISLFFPLPAILEDTISPTPKDLDEDLRQQMISETGFDNWRDWCVHNWGTKWDPRLYGAKFIDDNTLSLSFDSAWAPPIAFYEKLHSQGFGVKADYYEAGMDFPVVKLIKTNT